MRKYYDLIQKINASITKFNTHLVKDISLLNEKELNNPDYYMDLTKFSWKKDEEWINSGKRGVYFIFGVEEGNTHKLGLYIGKSSMNAYFGNRFHSHLYPTKKEVGHFMGNPKYCMELISTIPIEEEKVFLAPALEEFLIKQMKDKVHLINKTGK